MILKDLSTWKKKLYAVLISFLVMYALFNIMDLITEGYEKQDLKQLLISLSTSVILVLLFSVVFKKKET